MKKLILYSIITLSMFCLFMKYTSQIIFASERTSNNTKREFALNTTATSESPYYIKVSKSSHKLSIYSKDGEGKYTVLTAEHSVATGRTPGLTPVGTYTLGTKEEWHDWVKGGLTSPYTTSYAKGLYIHGPLFNSRNLKNVIPSSVSEIGSNKTSGCLRTTVDAAKFIYDNCPKGTKVEITN